MLSLRSVVGAAMISSGVLGAGVAVLVPSAPASAQFEFSGSRGGFGGAEISKSSVERYAKILSLDAAQKDAAMMLQETYAEATRRANEEMQQAMKAVKDEADGDFSVFGEKMPKIMETIGKKRAEAQKAFLNDLQTLLTPAQQESWPAVERLRRRQMYLSHGQVSGSSVDLTGIVDGLKLPESEAARLGPALEQYEFDMDRLLQEREKADGAAKEKFDFNPANFDMEKMRASMDEARVQALKVRDLNKKFERLLATDLSDANRLRFEAEVRKRTFRRIYSEPHVSKMLGAALRFDDLDPTQKKQLAEMQAQYERELEEANRKWAEALEQAETEGKAGGMPFMGGPGKSEELRAAEKARKDLDKKFSERVKTALNDKQRERLPKKESGDRMIHFDGDGEGGAVFIQAVEIDDGEGVQSDVQVIVGPGGG